jgi:hypothetical protein
MIASNHTLSRRTMLRWLAVSVAAGTLAALGGSVPSPTPKPDTLTIIPRKQWGAVEPDLNAPNERGLYNATANPEGWRVYDQPLAQILNTIVVHHSALPLGDGPREIQRLHMQQKGLADIGYHFVIDTAGWVYEGRSLTVRGAHTGGHNTGTVGIVLMGNFETIQPSESQLTHLKLLIRRLVDEYRITHLAGHRDFQPDETVCPGKNLEPLFPGMAVELGLRFGTDGYKPP